MVNKLIRENNPKLYERPQAREPMRNDSDIQLIVGNLNGNAMKLLYLLVEYGIALIDEESYFKLGQIFQESLVKLTKTKLKEFAQLLDKIQFKGGAKLVLLDGAVGGDEGNDYFTLLLMQKLLKRNVVIKTHLSSANAKLCRAYRNASPFNDGNLSMTHMERLLQDKLINRDEINLLIKNAFLPTLVPLSYQFTSDGFCIRAAYSLGLETLRDITKKLQIYYTANSGSEIASIIEKINKKYNHEHNSWQILSTSPNRNGKTAKNAFELIMGAVTSPPLERPQTLPSGEKLEFVHLDAAKHNLTDNIHSLQDTRDNLVALYCVNPIPAWQTALARASRNALLGKFYGFFKLQHSTDKSQSTSSVRFINTSS